MAGERFTAEVARLIFWIIWGTGAGVWALAFYRMQRFGKRAGEERPAYGESSLERGTDVADGARDVPLSADAAKSRLASFFAMNMQASASGISIADDRPHRLTLTRKSTLQHGGTQTQWGFDSVDFEFAPKGASMAEVRYRVVTARLARVMRTVGYVFVFLGGAALVAVAHVMLNYVVENPNPAVRYQVFQTLQAGHFLWPPFLMSYVYGRSRRGLCQFLENVIEGLSRHESA